MIRCAFVLALLGSQCACTTIGYYYQAMEGQMQIWNRSRPIAQVIEDSKTPAPVRDRLTLALRVREFASAELALPDNGSYRQYADLERPYVLWNVFAAAEFSVAPEQWCFPIAGCVAYRGYFKQTRAEQYGEQLRAQALDVFVAGVPAYSTLGWFDDPVLNTVMHYSDAELARLLFHELAHQVVYVPGDTVFNESFAVAVEQEGIERWLAREGNAAQRAAFDSGERRKIAFIDLMMKYRDQLKTLYASAAPDADKRQKKAETFAAMKADYQALKSFWGGYAGYDRFFAEDLNNAYLVPIAAYSELVAGFRRVLAENDGDFVRFYAAVREIGKLTKEQRAARLSGAPPNRGHT